PLAGFRIEIMRGFNTIECSVFAGQHITGGAFPSGVTKLESGGRWDAGAMSHFLSVYYIFGVGSERAIIIHGLRIQTPLRTVGEIIGCRIGEKGALAEADITGCRQAGGGIARGGSALMVAIGAGNANAQALEIRSARPRQRMRKDTPDQILILVAIA